MNSKTEDNQTRQIRESLSKKRIINQGLDNSETEIIPKENIEQICDENIITLEKIHAILLNCRNLSEKQKCEFAESERYFMKLHLKKLLEKLEQK